MTISVLITPKPKADETSLSVNTVNEHDDCLGPGTSCIQLLLKSPCLPPGSLGRSMSAGKKEMRVFLLLSERAHSHLWGGEGSFDLSACFKSSPKEVFIDLRDLISCLWYIAGIRNPQHFGARTNIPIN